MMRCDLAHTHRAAFKPPGHLISILLEFAGIGAQVSFSEERLEKQAQVNPQMGSKATAVLKLHVGSTAFFFSSSFCFCKIVDILASWKLLNLSNQEQEVSPSFSREVV